SQRRVRGLNLGQRAVDCGLGMRNRRLQMYACLHPPSFGGADSATVEVERGQGEANRKRKLHETALPGIAGSDMNLWPLARDLAAQLGLCLIVSRYIPQDIGARQKRVFA